MRFLELSLIAFGPFTERRIDLSGGKDGVHLIFGPNEAGKSTALRAVTDLLYGIPVQTRDAHVHDNSALRLGCKLARADGREIDFIRRKGVKRTLLAPSQDVLPDDVLEPFLGGVTRELFTTMFALDHERLVAGASSLLEGEGQLGASLYGASLGTTRLHSVLKLLEKEAEDLYNARGSRPKINQALKRFHELDKRARDLALPAQEWRRIERELEDLEAQRERTASERQDVSVRAARLDRIARALPKIGLYEQRLAEREQPVTLLPVDAAEKRRAALRLRGEAEQLEKKARRVIAELEERLTASPVPQPILDAEDRIAALKERLGDHRETAAELPAIEAEITRLDRDVSRLEGQLELSGAMPPEPPKRTAKTRVLTLARRHDELTAAIRRAIDEQIEARAARAATERSAAALNTAGDAREIRAAIKSAGRGRDFEAKLPTFLSSVAKLEAELERARSRLAPYELVPLPSAETIERFREELDRIIADRSLAGDRRREITARLSALEADLEVMTKVGAPPTEAELIAARQARDETWKSVVAKKSAALVSQMESAISTADELADRLRREAERVTQRASLEARAAADRRLLEDLAAEQDAITQRAEKYDRDWRGIWKGLTPATPKEMAAWCKRAEAAIALTAQLADARRDLLEAEQEIDAARAALQGGQGSIAFLIDAAESRAAEIEEQTRKRKSLEERLSELDQRAMLLEGTLADTNATLEEWRVEWHRALEAIGLKTDLAPPEVAITIESLDDLRAAIAEREGAVARRDQLKARLESFAAAARALIAELAPDLSATQEDRAIDALHRRSIEARRATATRDQLSERLSEANAELDAAITSREAAAADLAALLQLAAADDLKALEAAEEQSARRREVETQIRAIEAQLLELGGGAPLKVILAEAKEIAPDRVAIEARECAERLEELEKERSRLDQEIGARRNQQGGLDGRDDAAVAAEETQAAAAELGGYVDRYLKVRLAGRLLRLHIERYREENAGPLLERAGGLLAKLTLGSLSRLETAIDPNGRPILYGVRPSGQRIDVGAMSDGTRDQLYLALRIATLERYLGQPRAEPLPLIVDDVLLNFDDERSAATLQVLAELSGRTQVLFFTHHARLVDLAQGVIPRDALFVHLLGSCAPLAPPEARAV